MSRVLIVHHEPVQRHFLASFLEHEGFDVIQCAKAEDACRLFQAQDSIDALLVDLHLPGVNGWECCRLLREADDARFSTIPFLCLSSRLPRCEGERVTAYLGGQAFIPMPIEPAFLKQSLVEVLKGKRLVPSPRVLFVGSPAKWSGEQHRSFQQHGWVVHECQRVAEVQSQVTECPPDFLVIHHPVADTASLDWVSDLKAQIPVARIMLVTADQDPHVGVESLQCGVHEFMREPLALGYLELVFARSEQARLNQYFDLEDQTLSSVPPHLDDALNNFLHVLDEIVILTDGEGAIVDMNACGKALLEWTDQEVFGQSLTFLEPSGTLEGLFSSQPSFRAQEAQFRTQDGRTLDVLVSAYPVRSPEGPRCIIVANHVHELASLRAEVGRLNAQVSELKDLKSVETLAGGVAHDVNNILMAIQGHASLLMYKGTKDISTERPAEVIRQAAHRGQELTAQLLGKARRGKERRSSINVQDTIEEVLTLLSEDRLMGIEVSRDFQSQDAWVSGNARQLHQVVLNLIVNACDAMPRGGSLKISTISHPIGDHIDRQEASCFAEPFLELIVADTGCGIPEELQRTVFEPFFSTKPTNQGSGMGLAIVKEIVDALRGHLTIFSEVNKGTAFHLYFPQGSKSPSGLIHLPTVLGIPHPKVLVVDDEPLVVETTGEMLRLFECEPVLARSGEEAIDLYRDHTHEICGVVLDLSMPSMNGEDCFQALRALNPSVKIVFASGLEGKDSVQLLVDDGLAGFVQKPFDVEDLSQALKHVFSKNREDEGYALSGLTAGAKEGL